MNVELLHTTADVTTCDCCGRDGLKRTVKIAVDGKVRYFGTGCAARTYAAQWATEAELVKAAKAADKAQAAAGLAAQVQATEAARVTQDAAARARGYADWADLAIALGYAEARELAATL